MERDRFKTRTGFIIACIGSAVGMGNIWRFPIMMSKYGGMTFLLVYILFVILIASSGMIEEFALGRGAEAAPGAAILGEAIRMMISGGIFSIGNSTWQKIPFLHGGIPD